MTQDASIETFRAAVDALFPGREGKPSAVDLGAHEHVVELVGFGLPPGFVDLIAAVLDGFAEAAHPTRRFVDLAAADRVAVLRTISEAPDADTKDAADVFWVFTLGALYSEWTGSRTGTRPQLWDEVGYPGPSDGYPHYRQDV